MAFPVWTTRATEFLPEFHSLVLNSEFTKVNQFLTLVRQLSCLLRGSIGVTGIASLSHGASCQIIVNVEFMASLHSHLQSRKRREWLPNLPSRGS